MCDDEGRFLADPRQVKADVWPLDDDITPKKITTWLPQLAKIMVTLPDGLKVPAVVFYTVDGVTYGFLPGFIKHQKISHPTPSKLPKPPSTEAKNSGANPEQFPSDSGAAPEKLRPEEERRGEGLGLGEGLGSGEEGETSPRVELPREAERFLGMFYEPAFNDKQRKRYRDIKRQLYDVLDPNHPGPKIRGGARVKARSVEHLVDTLNAVMADPPPNRDHAILWLLNKLLDPPKGPSVTEAAKRKEEEQRRLQDRYHAQARAAGIEWANAHPDEYKPIVAQIEATYGANPSSFAKMTRDAELTQRTAKAAGFPAFEDWLENLREKQAVPA